MERDKSEKQHREAPLSLAPTEGLFRGLLESAPDAIVIVDQQGRIVLVNRRAKEQFGYTDEELLGQDVEILLPERFHKPHLNHRAHYMSHPRTRPMGMGLNLSARHKDGTEVPVEISLSPLDTPGGVLITCIIRDVTRRRQVEDALRRSEMRFAGILDIADEAIICIDQTQHITLFNQGAERLFGYESHEVIGHRLELLLPQRFAAQHHNLVAAFARAPESARKMGERRALFARHKEGHEFPAEASISKLELDSEWVFTVILRDISERKRAEAALRESEERFRGLVSSIFEGLVIHDQGEILEANAALVTMFGYSDAELQGMSLLTLLAPDSRATMLKRIQARFEGLYEVMGRRKDGTRFPLEIMAKTVPYAGREARVVALRDITLSQQRAIELERRFKEAESARAETRALLDAVDEAIVLMGTDQTVHLVNRRFGDYFKIEPHAVLGSTEDELEALLNEIFADSEGWHSLTAEARAMPGGTFSTVVTQVWPERRELALFSAPVSDGAGATTGRLLLFRDVTHARELERLKNEFVTIASHELRTPLTAIKGFTELLQSEVTGHLTEQQQEAIEVIQRSTERLLAMVHNLLDLSRIEAGKIELEPTLLDLREVARRETLLFQLLLHEKQQRLDLLLAESLPPVLADPALINQVFTNLLSNAHKYTPAGGQISVKVYQAGEHVAVAVQDTGVGLSPEEQARLFTRFFRGRQRQVREAGGTGLGLTIAQALIHLHGGEIRVVSSPNQGTTFTFTLPIAQA